tara:strand:- start:500 stop:859 length:360 start_codon:yes stop_codon:yes gene_type:complete
MTKKTTNKYKTAAAMGMLKLYNVSTRKAYCRETNFSIRAKDKREAEAIWKDYLDARFLQPNVDLPEGVCYHSREYRDREYDYDYDCDNTEENVTEVKFDKDNDLHQDIVESLYSEDDSK